MKAEAEKIAFDKIGEEALKDEPDEALLNLHRHLHGRAAQGECREREHGLVAAEMGRRGMQHDSGLECRKGLALPAPHGYLLWKGKQTAVAMDCKGLPLDQPLVAVCNGEAYGVATLGQPAEMALSEFDRVEWTTRHCVRPEERRAWWPEARKLYVYPLKDWERYDQPRLVCAPCDGQGLVDGVAFKEYQPPTDRERQVLAASEKLPRQIVLTPRAVSLTGSTLYGRGRQPRDVDVVLVGAEWRADEDQFVVPLTPTFKEKLERAFRAVYQTGNRVQYISEGQGPTFDHLPLYALALVRLPRLEIERVSEVEPEFAEMGYDKDGAKWDPNQPRDESGRFGSGGGASSIPSVSTKVDEGGFVKALDKAGFSPPRDIVSSYTYWDMVADPELSREKFQQRDAEDKQLRENGIQGVDKALKAAGIKSRAVTGDDIYWDWRKTANNEGGSQDLLQLVASQQEGNELANTTDGMKEASKLPDRDRQAAEIAYADIQNRTQEYLREKGYGPNDEIVVFRGITGDYANQIAKAAKAGEELSIGSSNPLSSWSLDPVVAFRFSEWEENGVVIASSVKVKDIFAHFAAGIGETNESEVILPVKAVPRAKIVYSAIPHA